MHLNNWLIIFLVTGLLIPVCMADTLSEPLDIIWSERIDPDAADDIEFLTSTSDGGFLLGLLNNNIHSISRYSGDMDLVWNQNITTDKYLLTKGSHSDINAVSTDDGGAVLFETWKDLQQQNQLRITHVNPSGIMAGSTSIPISADYIEDITPIGKGSFACTGGISTLPGDLSSSHAGGDVLLLEYDGINGTAREYAYGGTARDMGNCIISTRDGHFLVAGSTESVDGDIKRGLIGYIDGWVLDLNPDGTITWERCFGGSAGDRIFDGIRTEDGGYILVGSTLSHDGDIKNQNGYVDIFVTKLKQDGTTEWSQSIGNKGFDEGGALIPTDDGGVLILGTTSPEPLETEYDPKRDLLLAKLGSDGSLQWEKTYGGSREDYGIYIIPVKNGFLVAAGTDSGDGDMTGAGDKGGIWLGLFGKKSVSSPQEIVSQNQEAGVMQPASPVDLGQIQKPSDAKAPDGTTTSEATEPLHSPVIPTTQSSPLGVSLPIALVSAAFLIYLACFKSKR